MPTTTDVLEQVTDILVRVVGCSPDAVVPNARLKDLGVDSLTIVELGDELGRRHGIYLSDDTIDQMKTVKDAVNAVTRHDGTAVPAAAAAVASGGSRHPAVDPDERRSAIRRFGFWMVVVGAAIGAIIGFGGSALVGAAGLDSVDLPPISAPSTPAETTATPTPTPTPTPTQTEEPESEPSLQASSDQVSPGERVTLTGRLPGVDEGTTLQVEVKDGDTDWDEFPVDTEVRDDSGTFRTQVYTSRTGKRQFRLTDSESGRSTPAVTVTIG